MHKDEMMRVIGAFDLGAAVESAEPFGNGHINDTYLVKAGGRKYVLQRINTSIFTDPEGLMENVCAVTQHIARHIARRGGDVLRETLSVVLTRDGKPCYQGEEGCWRICGYITDSVTHESATPELLESAGRAFGRFVMDLGDFPAEKLHETIPMFHHTPNRLRQLQEAVEADKAGRLQEVGKELEDVLAFAGETSWLTDRLADGRLPLRVTHNDTKINNILFDAKTGEGMCVIDLDTVMPGLLAYDFGDAIRVGANKTDESDPDASHVGINLDNFIGFTRGLLSAVPSVLTDEEAKSLVMGAKLMTWENASRFLADYLNGDVYFRIHYPTQNLDRARNQIALVQAFDREQAALEKIVEDIWEQVKA